MAVEMHFKFLADLPRNVVFTLLVIEGDGWVAYRSNLLAGNDVQWKPDQRYMSRWQRLTAAWGKR